MQPTERPATTTDPISPIARLRRPRAAIIVYRFVEDQPQFLLVSSSANPNRLTLPGGKIGSNESAIQAAIRETVEEAGVLTHALRPIDQYLHPKRGRRLHPTQTFLAPFAGQLSTHEPRTQYWLSPEGLANLKYLGLKIRSPIRKQLAIALDILSDLRRIA